MRFEDRILMAFAYGELSTTEAARIAAALKDDPELAARIERFRSVRTALRKVYDSVADEPVPDHLRALLGEVAAKLPELPVVTPAPAASQKFQMPALAWAAIAAALIVGVLGGRLATPAPLFVLQHGQMQAGAELARALEHDLSNTPPSGLVRVGASFFAGGDGVCRTFAREAVSGIACREGELWTIRFAASPGEGPDPRAALMAMVDTMIDGEPLTPAEETEARARDWRR